MNKLTQVGDPNDSDFEHPNSNAKRLVTTKTC